MSKGIISDLSLANCVFFAIVGDRLSEFPQFFNILVSIKFESTIRSQPYYIDNNIYSSLPSR
jgi:hypothetical protein